MKWRCPYCKVINQGEITAICPACKKAIKPKEEKKVFKTEEQKQAERVERIMKKIGPAGMTIFDPFNVKISSKPIIVVFFVTVFMLTIMLMFGRSRQPFDFIAQHNSVLAASAQQDVDTIRLALDNYKNDVRHYPSTEQGLMALLNDPGEQRWQSHYVTHLRPDPWSKRYFYVCTNETPYIFSRGPDGIAWTDDDVRPRCDTNLYRCELLTDVTNLVSVDPKPKTSTNQLQVTIITNLSELGR